MLSNKKRRKNMMYTSCWPWQPFILMIIISASQCDTWEWIHSSIFFMHPSNLPPILYLYLHWTYSWIISIGFPLAPVKHRLAQVATLLLSDLDSWITASLWVRWGGRNNTLLFIRVRNSCIRPANCEALLQHNISQIKWCEIKGGRELASIPSNTPHPI